MEEQIIANVELDGSKVHWGETRVDDDCKHNTIPEVEQRILIIDLQLVLPRATLLFWSIFTVLLATCLVSEVAITLVMPLVSFERILSLVKLHAHVRSAVDEHRFVLLGPLFLLTQVLNYRCLQSGLCGNLTLVAHASDTVRFIHRRESTRRESLVLYAVKKLC